MDSVGPEALGERDAVVDDEGDVRIGANPLQRLGELGKLMFVDSLDPQLKRGRKPRLERRLQPVGKVPADLLRANQIELACSPPLRSEGRGKVVGDLVRNQAGTFCVEAS